MTLSNRLLTLATAFYVSCAPAVDPTPPQTPLYSYKTENGTYTFESRYEKDLLVMRFEFNSLLNDFQTEEGKRAVFAHAWDTQSLDHARYDEDKVVNYLMPYYLNHLLYDNALTAVNVQAIDASTRNAYRTSLFEKAKAEGDFETARKIATQYDLVFLDGLFTEQISYYEGQHNFQDAIQLAKENPMRVAEIQRNAVSYYIKECKQKGQCSDLFIHASLLDPKKDGALVVSAVDTLSNKFQYREALELAQKTGLDRKAQQIYNDMTWSCKTGEYNDFSSDISSCIAAAEVMENNTDRTRFEATREKYRARIHKEIDAALEASEDGKATKAKKHYKAALALSVSARGQKILGYDAERVIRKIKEELPIAEAIDLFISSTDIATRWEAIELAKNADYDVIEKNAALLERVAATARRMNNYANAVEIERKMRHLDHALAIAQEGAAWNFSRGGYSMGSSTEHLYFIAANMLSAKDPRKNEFLRKHIGAHMTEGTYYPKDVKLAQEMGDAPLAKSIVESYMQFCESDPRGWFCSAEKENIAQLARDTFSASREIQFLVRIGDCTSAVPLAIDAKDIQLLDDVADTCVPTLESNAWSSDLSTLSSLESARGNTKRAETYALFARVLQANRH